MAGPVPNRQMAPAVSAGHRVRDYCHYRFCIALNNSGNRCASFVRHGVEINGSRYSYTMTISDSPFHMGLTLPLAQRGIRPLIPAVQVDD